MNRNEQFLSLIGLCLRGRNLEVGEEPVEAVARARDARVLLLASDAADNTARRVRHFAEAGQCVWLRIPFTKQELGQATGRGSAAVVAITETGLPAAVFRRIRRQRAEKAGPRRTAENGGAAKSFAKDDRTGRPFRKSGSRPSKSNRPKPKGRPNPYAHSRPVKKGKGSFRKKES